MTTKLKSIVTRAVALAFTFTTALVAGSAWAAVPVAIWQLNELVDGAQYTSPAGIVYTLHANGNTVEDGGITISSTNGVSVTPASGNIGSQAATTIIRYTGFDTSALTSNDARVLVMNHTTNASYKDFIGAAATQGGNIWGLWQNTTWQQNKTNSGAYGSTAEDEKTFAFAWAQTGTAGAYFWINGANKNGWGGLHGNLEIDSIWIGGPYESTTTQPATGMKITGIAIFDSRIPDAEIANFKWPKPIVKTTPRVFAFNFDSKSGEMKGTGDSGIPYFDLPGNCWNNLTEASSARAMSADGFDLSAPVPVEAWIEEAARVAWASANTYSWGAETMPALKGYLDDGEHDGVNGPTVTVSSLPFEVYDVIVLFSTDSGDKFRPVTVNGISYTADADGYGVVGTANWGTTHLPVPMAGQNMMYIQAQSGELTIHGGNRVDSARGGIAAVIVAETGTRKASISGNVDWTAITWTGSENLECPHILTISGDTKVTVNAEVEIGKLIVNGTGALTIVDDGKLHCSQLDVGDRAFTYECGEGAAVSLNMTGTGAFVKRGEGTLTLPVTFVPASITVAAGVLKAPLNATDWAFSTTDNEKTITVAEGAQFDLNGSYNRPISYTIAGDGPEGTGAILKPNGNGNSNQIALGSKLELAADATINTVGRWCMINNSHAANKLNLAGFTLTKIGAGNLVFSNTTVENGGTLVIKQGTVMCNAWLGEGGGGRFWEGFGEATVVIDGGTLNVNHGYITDGSPFVLGTLDFKTGSVTVGGDVGFTVEDEIVLPESALTTPVVTGNLTLGENAKIRFPAGYAGGAAYHLCSGTLTGREGTVDDAEFYIGDTPTVGTLIYANGTVVYDRGAVDLAPEGDVTTAWINEQLAGKDLGTAVSLTIKPNATLTIDEAFAFARLNIACEGNFYLATADGAAPSEAAVAKFFYDGVTGSVIRKWLAMKRVINLNFRDASGRFEADDLSDDGLLAGNTPKASWINLGNDASRSDVAITNAWNVETFAVEEIDGMTVTWEANTVWAADQTIPVLKGYLDDGNAEGVKITLKGVPFEMYDVIVYYNTDMANRVNPAVKVNGVAYTWDSEQTKTVVGPENWGATYHDGVAYGVNALRISDLAGEVKITTAQRDDKQNLRGCVPAIQIVEVERKEFKNVYTAEDEGDVLVSEINAYVASGAPYSGPVTVNLKGGNLVFDEAFNYVALTVNSTGDLIVRGDGTYVMTDDDWGKVVYGAVDGTIIFNADSQLPTTPPAAGVTYRYTGMTLDAIPFVNNAVAGTIELDCALTSLTGTQDGKITYSKNSIVFGPNFSCDDSITFVRLGNDGGQTQNFTQNGGALTLRKEGNDGTSTDRAFTIAHWSGNVTYNLVGGTIDVPNDNTVFGWDGTAHMVIGGGDIAARLTTKGIATGQGNNKNELTIGDRGTLAIGSYGLDLKSNSSMTLAGGTLEAYDTCAFNAPGGIAVISNSTISVLEGFALTLNAPLMGVGNIAKIGTGSLDIRGSLANFAGKIVADAEDVISLTNNVLPFTDGMLAKIEGTVKINAASSDNFFKICEGMGAIPENLKIFGTNDLRIVQLCVVDGDLYYGYAEGEFELTNQELAEIETLTVGGVCTIEKPTLNVTETCTNLPEGFGFIRDGRVIYLFRKSDSISLKLGTRTSNKESAILRTDTNVGGFPVAGVVWNNGRVWNNNDGSVTFSDYVQLMDGNGKMTTATVAYFAPNTYFNKDCPLDSGNQRLTSTYLDDGSTSGETIFNVTYSSQGLELPEGGMALPVTPNARGWEMEIANIPYEMYDLYVYIASDQASGFKGCPVTVSADGENWKYYAGAAAGTDDSVWSPVPYSTDGTLAEGRNYIRFRISKASMGVEDVSKIFLSHGTRNTGSGKRLGLAGIQIVKIDDDGVRTRTTEGDWHAEGGWKNSNGEIVDWADPQEGEVITAIINADEIHSIAMDGNAEATKVKITSTNETVFTIERGGTLTAGSIDMSDFYGELRIYAQIIGPIGLGEHCFVTLGADALEGEFGYDFVGGRVVVEVTDERELTIPAALGNVNLEIVVKDGGNLKLAFDSAIPQSGYTYSAKVIVEEGGVYDVNGQPDFSHPIVLKGGALTNTGNAIGTNTRQYWQNSLEADSIVDVSGHRFGAINSGHAVHNYRLNGYTLEKKGEVADGNEGDGDYYISNAIYDSGTILVSEGSLTMRAFTIAEGEDLVVNVASGAKLKLTNGETKNGTFSITGAGTVQQDVATTVDNISGSPTFTGTNTVTITGTISGSPTLGSVRLGDDAHNEITLKLDPARKAYMTADDIVFGATVHLDLDGIDLEKNFNPIPVLYLTSGFPVFQSSFSGIPEKWELRRGSDGVWKLFKPHFLLILK